MERAFIDRFLKRHRDAYEPPARLFVITVNQDRFLWWCRANGIPPYGKDTHAISTSMYSGNLRGFKMTPRDRIVVLDTAPFGRRWKEVRKDMIIASMGWIDLDERKESDG